MADSIRVLHVDDEPGFADTAAAFLERENERLTVETATSASEGVERLDNTDIHCIVSDYDMPGMNGIEFLEAARAEYPDLPFILFTGKGSEEIASEAVSAGVTDYLQKGTGTDQYTLLAHRITNAVAGYRTATQATQRQYRLEQILKTVPGCVVQLDAEGEFVYANRRAEEVLGLTESGLTDRAYNDPEWHIRDLDGDPIPDEDLPFAQVRDSGEPVYGIRHTIQWPDETERILRVNGAPLFDERGNVDSVVCSLIDITDEYEREHALEATEQRLDLALDATDTGVWEWRLPSDDVRWSETLERVMGLGPGSFEGTLEAFIERVHPDDLPTVQAELDEAIETDSTYDTEFRMFDADGRVRWVSVRGTLLGEGDDRRMVGIHQDITARKQLAAELAATNEQYRTLVENFPGGGVFLYNEDLECLVADGTGLSSVGLTPDDVTGTKPRERYPEALAAPLEENLRAALGGETSHLEQEFQGRYFSVRTAPVEGDEGEIDRAMAVSQEVTEQREREQELDRQRSLLKAQQEATLDGMLVVDDGEMVSYNDRFVDLWGIPEDLLETENEDRVLEWVTDQLANPEAFRDRLNSLYDRSTETSRDEIELADGRVFDRYSAPVTDEEGSHYGRLWTFRDVTERKDRERELERYEAYLQESTDIITILDESGTVNYQSPSVSRILGYDQGELVGDDAFEYVHPDDRDEVWAEFVDLVNGPGATVTAECRFRTADGEWRWLEIRGTDQLDNDAINGIVTNNRDVTERKRQQQELTRQNERLEEFASVVAHDLRSPLSVATARLELAEADTESEHLEAAATALERSQTLIDDLMQLARTEGRLGETEPVDVGELAERSWQSVAATHCDLRVEAAPRVMADRARLQQLLENLLRNAVDHGGDEVTVTVGATENGFYVADDGPGIPESDRDTVFELGQSTVEQGTGFGLAIVDEIAEAHGWEIDVTTSHAGGARFEIRGVDAGELD